MSEYEALYQRFLARRCSREEAELLLQYFRTVEGDAGLVRLIETRLDEWPDETALTPDDHVAIARNADRLEDIISRKTRKLTRWLPYAAAVAVLLAVGWLLLVDSRQSSVLPTGQAGDRLAATEIQPGGNRAVLTLADGRTIDLSEAQTGIVIGAEDITYQDGSSLEAVMVSGVEPSLPNSAEAHSTSLRSLPTAQGDAPAMLALTTPKGGTYQVTLPDGSKVWLNSASTLKYPSRFSGDSREVILEGEAFFDVVSMDRARITDARERSGSGTRDTRAPSALELDAGARVSRVPFKVQTSGQTVEVLGTQFNISAYADDEDTKTTLVEGKVSVRHSERGNSEGHAGSRTFSMGPTAGGRGTHQIISAHQTPITLTPGQQAATRGSAITISEVDVAQYTSWKSGAISFDGKTFAEAMREVARWYDIEIDYAGAIPTVDLFGSINRGKNLSAVLALLESSGIHYTLHNRKLTINDDGAKPGAAPKAERSSR